MNTTVMKTKAERAIPEQFEAALPGLPGGAKALNARRAAMAHFIDLGLPHRRIEEWKYTDLRARLQEAFVPAPKSQNTVSPEALASALGPFAALTCARLVFVDGRHEFGLSSLDGLAGAKVSALADGTGDDRLAAIVGSAADAVVALNVAFASDGAVVDVPASVTLDQPLMLVFLSTAVVPSTITTRCFINVGDGASATVLEVHAQIGASAVQSNAVAELTVGNRATVDHVKVVLGAANGVHLSNWDVRVGANALYRAAQLTPSAGLARNEIHISLEGRDSKFDFAGVALGRNSDHIDTTMQIRHLAPGC